MEAVERWLKDINLQQYKQDMIDQGWDSLQSIRLMTEDDVADIFTRVGHRKLFLAELQKQKDNNSVMSPSSTPSRKRKFIQVTLTSGTSFYFIYSPLLTMRLLYN